MKESWKRGCALNSLQGKYLPLMKVAGAAENSLLSTLFQNGTMSNLEIDGQTCSINSSVLFTVSDCRRNFSHRAEKQFVCGRLKAMEPVLAVGVVKRVV